MLKRLLSRYYYEGVLYIVNRLISIIPSHGLRKAVYRRILKCKIGRNSYIFMGAWFDSMGNFEMGDNSVINQNCRLDNRGGIYIGKNVSISAEVCILTGDHDPQSPTFAGRIRPVRINDYSFIGTRAMILPGLSIGRGSIVAAGSVVTKDVSDFMIVAGVPARPIGDREKSLDYSVDYCRLFH